MVKQPLQDHQRITIKSKSTHSESPIKPLSEGKKSEHKVRRRIEDLLDEQAFHQLWDTFE
ncbi:hypothetical protein [Vibrio tapetis]|uniref:Uncharacterized protein n=1 Tax=Vibrio tapetis subsp. tapetis TaxID=1671868 RepID=A0A2N8ZHL0_9VIBR|nr:hypothetical protein [Vibrio tapetis]SON51392.1 conserved protein of unknown function [Vibrio tapetis subsp. tapetis]